jgi:hypothetical protein
MKILLTLALTLILMTGFVYAHGGMEHVMGTIASISATSITVATTDGKSQTVLLTADTKYAKNDTAIPVSEIKVGDSVVIHATRKANELTAATVKVGASRRQAMGNSTAAQAPK